MGHFEAASHESEADSLFCFLALAICTLAKVLRARCGSERLLPFSSVQGFPAAAPHVGQIAVNAGLSICLAPMLTMAGRPNETLRRSGQLGNCAELDTSNARAPLSHSGNHRENFEDHALAHFLPRP